MLSTENSDAKNDSNDEAAWLHKLRRPLANSAKSSGLYDSLQFLIL